MKYIKSINESHYSEPFNKSIKDFIQSQRDKFKSVVDESMYDMLDEYRHTSGFNDRFNDIHNDCKKGDICVYYNIFIPGNDDIYGLIWNGDFENHLKSCVTRLTALGSHFKIRVSYENNINFSRTGPLVSSGSHSTSGTNKYIHLGNEEDSKYIDTLVEEICKDITNVDLKNYNHVVIGFNVW